MDKENDSVKVTINMPMSYHRKLKAIAAIKGIGLSKYIIECVEKLALRKKDIDGKELLEDDAVKEVNELIETQS